MSRLLLRLSELGLLLSAFGCSTSAGALGTPPGLGGNAGGTTSTDSSTPTTGGEPSATGGVGSLGGGLATGGTVQTSPATGGATGVVVPTGGSTATTPAAAVVMTLTNLSADTLQGNLEITLPTGAAAVPMSTLKLKLCGAGAGALIQPVALQIYDGRLTCPQVVNTDCPQGQSNSFQSLVKITASGTPANCCFNFDFTSVPSALVAGQGGKITLNYAQDASKGVTLGHQSAQVWTALVGGAAASGTCTIPSTSSIPVCG